MILIIIYLVIGIIYALYDTDKKKDMMPIEGNFAFAMFIRFWIVVCIWVFMIFDKDNQ